MGAITLLATSELRRRLLSLGAIALMVAFVSGAVAAGFAGARRTSSSVERFRDWAHASDGTFQTSAPEQGPLFANLLRRQPDVERIGDRYLVNGWLTGRPIRDIAIMSDPEGHWAYDIDRARVLHGRMPASNAPDEIALNELAARLLRVRVGDTLPMQTWSQGDMLALFTNENASGGFNGPRLTMRIVGVVRVVDGLPGDVQRTSPYGIASSAFLAHYRHGPDATRLGVWPPSVYVRTRGGAAGFAALSTRLGGTTLPDAPTVRLPTGAAAGPDYLDASQKAANTATTGLLVFAIAALLVGAIVVGQAVQRHLAGGTPPSHVAQLGMTRTEIAVAQSIPVAVVAAIGVIAGLVLAIALSPLAPIGLARRAEIDPGIRIDPLVLLACAATVLLLVTAYAFVASRRALAPATTERMRVRSSPASVRAVARAGAPPVVETGIRFAADRRSAGRSVPVRTAFAGLAIAIATTAAAAVLHSSYTQLRDDPARWGWNWSSEPDYFGRTTMQAMGARLVADPRIAAVGEFDEGNVSLEGVDVAAIAVRPVRGEMSVALRRGRLPVSDNEIAVGEATLRQAHAHIGDAVSMQYPGGKRATVTIVGTAVIPYTENRTVNTGVVLTPRAFDAKQQDGPNSAFILRYPPGSNVAAIEAALAKDYGLEFNPFTTAQVPGVVSNIAESGTVAVALAIFFALLGTLALAHALVSGTARRRLHLGVLRALGFRPAQVRAAIVVQSITLALVAVVVGLPLGIVVGRWLWHLVSDDIGALNAPATPWLVILLALPVTVAWACALAWWPARRASRASVAASLRAE